MAVELETDQNAIADNTQAVEPSTGAPAPLEKQEATLRETLEASLKEISDRARDEQGRFAKGEQAKTQPAKADPAKTAPVVPVANQRPADLPRGWKSEHAQHWGNISPEAKAIIAEREAQMDSFGKRYEGLGKYADALEANGSNLATYVDNIVKIEQSIQSDPIKGTWQTLQALNMDPVQIAQGILQAAGVLDQAMSQQGQAQPVGIPPQLLQRIDAIEQQNRELANFARSQNLEKTQAEVVAFLQDPANAYANDAIDAIAAEVERMKRAGEQPNLKVAYDRAIWTNPDLREKVIADQNRKALEEKSKTASQAVATARNASRSVAGSPLPNGVSHTNNGASTRTILEAKLAEMRGRA